MSTLSIIDVFRGLKPKNDNAEHVNSAAIVILTTILVCAGWLQFKDLNKTSKGDFLLRIVERYGQIEIIKARTIIHEYYCLTYEDNIDITTHVKKISKLVKYSKNNINESENFVYLLNFLEFLETISYFANKDYISSEEVNELVGSSLKYYFCIFEDLINKRRRKYNCDNFYSELESIAKEIQKSQCKSNLHIPPIIGL